jgi:predicted dehydrogenase
VRPGVPLQGRGATGWIDGDLFEYEHEHEYDYDFVEAIMEPVRLGIVGVGQIGKHHLQNYAKIPGVEMVALADIDVPEGKRVSEEYKIPNVYTDFRELLRRDDIQAVDVCLHNNLHMPVTVAALEAGKDVYCEKPMAGSYTDAKTMYDAAQALGRKLSIQLSTLYSNETRAAKQLIEDGHLGKVYHARSTGFRRRGRPYVDGYGTSSFVQKSISGGGAFYDMGVYHIAMMLYLLGSPAVQRISGKIYQETDYDMTRPDSHLYNVEELGMGFVKFADNITLDIIESWIRSASSPAWAIFR